MREPYIVKRATSTGSHAFLFNKPNHYYIRLGEPTDTLDKSSSIVALLQCFLNLAQEIGMYLFID